MFFEIRFPFGSRVFESPHSDQERTDSISYLFFSFIALVVDWWYNQLDKLEFVEQLDKLEFVAQFEMIA